MNRRDKPHLIKFLGIWHCRSIKNKWIGIGYTPADAYRDWSKFFE